MKGEAEAALEGLEPIEKARPQIDRAIMAKDAMLLERDGTSSEVRRISRPAPRWLRTLRVLGPGLIAASAGNDAGGIATYSAAGAQYGYDLIWIMVLLIVPLAFVQESCSRLAAATGRGLLDLIRERFGWNWALFAILVVLVANSGLMVSEFVGLGEAAEILGFTRWVAVPLAALGLWGLVYYWSYARVEKILLLLTVVFLVYPAAAFAGHPHTAELVRGALVPQIRPDPQFIMLLVALLGTTITPYMQVYQQSSVVEQGAYRKNYGRERWDAYIGCLLSNLMSISMMVATAATLHVAGKTKINSAADAAKALEPVVGHWAGTLFAVGLLGATALAAAVLALSTAYAVTEALGATKGVDLDFRRAPTFFRLFSALLLLGVVGALLPGLPVMPLLVGIQVLNGALLPAILVFILLLSSDGLLMGKLQNSRAEKWVGWLTVISITGAVLALFTLQLKGQ